MNKIFSIILLVGGIALVIFGVSAASSLSSDVSNFFTGLPTDKAIWMLVAGVVAALIGLAGMMRRPRQG